jgi:hypothetical protein
VAAASARVGSTIVLDGLETTEQANEQRHATENDCNGQELSRDAESDCGLH